MLFSSIPFLFYFLPIVIVLYFLSPWKLKNTVLLLSSLFFYGWGEPKYVFLMISAIIVFYTLGLCVEKIQNSIGRKLVVGVAVLYSVLMMGIFKYSDFFITNFNYVTGLSVPLLKLALPIGISFYTFQCLSYIIDVYRKDVKAQKNIISFGTYVSLFPQLIAGPIVRYVDVEKEINHRTHSLTLISDGLTRFVIGLGKKILIANQLGEFVNIFRETKETSVLFYWMYAIAFMLHIYFDFSGYSDMAIGLGKIFGFNFIENFNYPYMSKSIAEFWRRWHMSLGSWFRDYVYFPMGGSRVNTVRLVINTLTVWMLTGLWHGASWNFVLWGLMYAALLLIEKKIKFLQKLPNVFQHVYTLFFVMMGFVLFNAVDLTQAWIDICSMFNFSLPLVTKETLYYVQSYIMFFIIGIIGATPFITNCVKKIGQKYPYTSAVLEPVFVLIVFVVCTAYLIDGSFNPFLYFRF